MSIPANVLAAEGEARADNEIAKGMAAVGLLSLLPGAVSWMGWLGAVGLMTNNIADAYNYYDPKRDNIGERVTGIIFSAGAGWVIGAGGIQLLSALLDFTGLGYPVGVLIRGTSGIAMTYAVGQGAKGYYRAKAEGRNLSNDELGQIVRSSYSDAQARKIAERVQAEAKGRNLSEEELTEVIKRAIQEDKS